MLDTELDEIECLRGLRVLVVEDAPSVAKALRNMLEDFGVVVVGPVSTPDAALQLLTGFSPDLALVDMHLDGFTGYALVERMRRLGVPVLAVSGSAEFPREGPKVATLQKPFSGQALLTIICQLVCTPLLRLTTSTAATANRSPAIADGEAGVPIEFRLYLADVLDSSRMKGSPGPLTLVRGVPVIRKPRHDSGTARDWSKPRIAARRM